MKSTAYEINRLKRQKLLKQRRKIDDELSDYVPPKKITLDSIVNDQRLNCPY